jgi:hypothetical protein
MPIGYSAEGRRERLLEVIALRWMERGAGSFRWWETAPAEAGVPRAVVIWLRDLGRVAWWIADGELTLALGYFDSLEEPSNAIIEKAKRAAGRRWLELVR